MLPASTTAADFARSFLLAAADTHLCWWVGGTGFAPIWAVAQAALRENPSQPIWLVGGVRKRPQLYMLPALQAAHRFPNVTAVATVESAENLPRFIKPGTPDVDRPTLTADDNVYAASSSVMVDLWLLPQQARAPRYTATRSSLLGRLAHPMSC